MTNNGPVFPLEPSSLLPGVVALKHSKWKNHYNVKKKYINKITQKKYQVNLIQKAYAKLPVITKSKNYN